MADDEEKLKQLLPVCTTTKEIAHVGACPPKPGRSLKVSAEELHAMAKRIAYEGVARKPFNEKRLPLAAQVDRIIASISQRWHIHHHPLLIHRKRHYSVRSHNVMEDALNFTTFIPKNRQSDLAPVVAFGGSDTFGDWLTDFEPQYPGYTQFSRKNRKYIKEQVTAALKPWVGSQTERSDFRGLVLTGHSLGGGLAQMAAVKLFPLCARVVTFQTVGVGRPFGSFSESPQDGGFAGSSPHRPKVVHYMAFGGVVSAAGASILPGEFRLRGRPKPYPKHGELDVVMLHRMNLCPLANRQHVTVNKDPYGHKLRGSNKSARALIDQLRLTIGRQLTILRNGYDKPLTKDALLGEFLNMASAKLLEIDEKTDYSGRPLGTQHAGPSEMVMAARAAAQQLLTRIRVFLTQLFRATVKTIALLKKDTRYPPVVRLTQILQWTVVTLFDQCMKLNVESSAGTAALGVSGYILLPTAMQFAVPVSQFRAEHGWK